MLGLRESELLAVDLPPGPRWLDILREVWDAGAAVLPLDHRLPDPARARLLDAARPSLVLRSEGIARLDEGIPVEHGIALVVATSGSLGEPKLVELRRDGVEHAIRASATRLGASDHDPWLCALTPAHMGGLLVLLRGVVLGSRVEVHARFDPAQVASSDATFTSLVPTMLARVLDAGVPRFRSALIGGARLPDSLRARGAATGLTMVETYGLTESSGGVVYDGAPLDGIDVRIGDAGDVRIGDAGDVQLRGLPMMARYRLDDRATAAAFTEDGWLRTADAGSLAGGTLRVSGRLDDAIRTGGETVWPAAVEEVLRDDPRVADVAIAGVADDEWGEVVVAYVVPRSADEPPSLDDLRARCSERIGRHAAPKRLIILPDLPRTTSGKVLRRALPSVPSLPGTLPA